MKGGTSRLCLASGIRGMFQRGMFQRHVELTIIIIYMLRNSDNIIMRVGTLVFSFTKQTDMMPGKRQGNVLFYRNRQTDMLPGKRQGMICSTGTDRQICCQERDRE